MQLPSPLPPVIWQQLPNAPAPGTRVAALDALPDGGARLFSFGAAVDPFRLVVLRSEQRVFGYLNRCVHFGVPLAQTESQLIFKPHESLSCNVHYARFRWVDGACDFGECDGEGLTRVPLVLVDGEVRIGGEVSSEAAK
jgi:nitrite reductase/ring-hydroxylating ferredoxin subunit